MMALPVAVEPVNMILPTAGCSARRAPTSRPPRDHGEEALGEFLVDDLDQGQHAQRGVFGGLDDDGVAHAQGRGDLPDGDHHGPVPRADRADDADGPVVQFGVGFAVVHHGLRGQFGRGGGAQPGGAGADLEAGVGAVERLALLPGEQHGQCLGGAFDGVGRPEQRGAAGFVAQGGPSRLGGGGGGDGAFQVLQRCGRGPRPTASPVAGSSRVRVVAGGGCDGGEYVGVRFH